MQPLPSTAWIQPDWLARSALDVAPDLLGCTLVRRLPDGQLLRGTIVETEAYTPDDPACHAYRRRTPRNAVMFGPAGMAYVYLIYGMYHCLNVVTDADGQPSAVLLRALQLHNPPADSVISTPTTPAKPSTPSQRQTNVHRLAAGPGKLCRALHIDRQFTERPFHPDSHLWLEHRPQPLQQQMESGQIEFVQTTRIGITVGADLPWRWYVANSPAVSKR